MGGGEISCAIAEEKGSSAGSNANASAPISRTELRNLLELFLIMDSCGCAAFRAERLRLSDAVSYLNEAMPLESEAQPPSGFDG